MMPTALGRVKLVGVRSVGAILRQRARICLFGDLIVIGS